MISRLISFIHTRSLTVLIKAGDENMIKSVQAQAFNWQRSRKLWSGFLLVFFTFLNYLTWKLR